MLNDLTICIPTYGRSEYEIKTLQFIGKTLRPRTFLVVNHEEAHAYDAKWKNILVVPKGIKGIASVRAYLFQNSPTRYLMMLDDDLYFYWRDKDLVLHRMNRKRFLRMVKEIRTELDTFAHIGISHRGFNKSKHRPFYLNTRVMNAYAYDTARVLKSGVEFNRVKVMEDFDLTLQLLKLGYPNKVFFKYAWNQQGSNTSGGCSGYRTAKVQSMAAKKLRRMHPDVVKLVKKKIESKENWKGIKERTDVQVDWNKAAEIGNRSTLL